MRETAKPVQLSPNPSRSGPSLWSVTLWWCSRWLSLIFLLLTLRDSEAPAGEAETTTGPAVETMDATQEISLPTGPDQKAATGEETLWTEWYEKDYWKNLEIKRELGRFLENKKPEWFYDSGLWVVSHDRNLQLKIGGRLHYDALAGSVDEDITDAFDALDRGAGFRRFRLDLQGVLFGSVLYKFDYDLADRTVGLRDLFFDITKVPWIKNLRFGHFPEPFSLENRTSTNHTTFLERGLPWAFAPPSANGVMAHRSFLDDRIKVAVGGFHDGSALFRSSSTGWSFTTNVTGLVWREKDPNRLLHVGGSFSTRDPYKSEFRVKVLPEIGRGEPWLDTDTIVAEQVNLYGLETAWVFGPLSVQGEFSWADLEPAGVFASPSTDLYGFYVFTSYFLTGESRPYSYGAFHNVVPKRDFLRRDGGGWGAWEVAGRLSQIDVQENDEVPTEGKLTDLTFGLNWYWNRNSRLMFNYVLPILDRNDVEGSGHLFSARVDVHF